MKPVKNIVLQEMLRIAQSFCITHLDVFLTKFELKSAQLRALGTSQTAADVLAYTQLPKSAHKEFTNTFLASTLYSFADFRDILETSDAAPVHSGRSSATLEGDLALPGMIDKAEQRFSELLYMLNKRLSVLSQHKIVTANNPIAPLSFALALEQAMQNLPWDLHTRIVAIKVFDYEFLRQLGAVYIEINQHLANQGILPNLKHIGDEGAQQRTSPTDAQLAFMAAHEAADAVTDEAGASHLFNADTTAAANDGSDLDPVEYVGELFQQFLGNVAAGDHLKNHLSCLYTPYVKLALADKSFANSERHPARHLIDSLNEACLIYSEKASELQKPALLLEMKSVVQRLVEDSDGNRKVFSDLAFRFSAYLRQFNRQVEQQHSKRQKARDGHARLLQLKKHISEIVHAKLKDHERAVPSSVAIFLNSTWTNYATSQYLSGCADGEQASQTLALIDPILAYVAPMEGQTAPDFTVIAPPIRQSLIAAGSEDLEIRYFLQELIKFHRAAHLIASKRRGNTA